MPQFKRNLKNPAISNRHLKIEFAFEMFVWSAQHMPLLFILQEIEVQPTIQIESEPSKNPKPTQNPDVCLTFFSRNIL